MSRDSRITLESLVRYTESQGIDPGSRTKLARGLQRASKSIDPPFQFTNDLPFEFWLGVYIGRLSMVAK